MYSLVKSDQIAAISLHGIIFDFIDDLLQDVAEYEKWLNYTYNSGNLTRKE